MSKLVRVDVVETRRKTKMVLELTDDEVVDLVCLMEEHKTHQMGWGYSTRALAPRMESLLHNLKSGPTDVRVEEINRGSTP